MKYRSGMDLELEQLAAAAEEAIDADLTDASDAALLHRLRELHRIRNAVDAALVAAVGAVNRRGAENHDGAVSTSSWIKARLRESWIRARDLVTASKLLAATPAFADDFRAGRLSLAHVLVAARLAKKVGDEKAPEALDALLGPALAMDPSSLEHVAKRIRELICLNDEGEPDPRDKHDRSLFVSATFEGRGVVQGDLTPETTAKFLTVLNARMGAPAPDDDRAPAQRRHDGLDETLDFVLAHMDLPMVAGERPHLGVIVHARDLQKPALGRKSRLKPVVHFDGEDSLATMYAYLDDHTEPVVPDWINDPDPGTDEATVDWDAVLAFWVDDADFASADLLNAPLGRAVLPPDSGPVSDAHLTELRALPDVAPVSLAGVIDSMFPTGSHRSRLPGPGTGGITEWGGRIPSEAIRRLACDAGLHRVVFGPGDVPLSAGRQVRLVRAAQHRVLVARDGGCRFHGCDRPPAWTQAHHVVHWADGGPTDVDNMILLCGHHHHRVHDDGWSLEFDGRTVTIRRPDGTVLGPP